MLNFVADPGLLAPLVPAGTELDYYRDETFLSVVGFMFLETRVLGLPIPRHRDFEEVNLRFYVRKRSPDGWRRGVVFVRELVPRRAIAFVASAFYGEPYLALPMRHAIARNENRLSVEYQWRPHDRTWETLAMTASGEARDLGEDSHEEFIAEHYWGYTKRPTTTSEYRVEHPRWRYWRALDVEIRSGRGRSSTARDSWRRWPPSRSRPSSPKVHACRCTVRLRTRLERSCVD